MKNEKDILAYAKSVARGSFNGQRATLGQLKNELKQLFRVSDKEAKRIAERAFLGE